MSGFGTIFGLYVRRAITYRWIVLVPTVLVFAIVTLYVMIQPDVYESQAVLMAPIVRPDSGAANQDARELQQNTLRSAQERLLGSRMLLRVIDEVDPYPVQREMKGVDAVVDLLRRKIRIDPKTQGGVITVTCSHSQGDRPAEMAARIVNSLTQQFVDMQRDAIKDKVSGQKQFLDTEKVRLHRVLDQAQALLDEFRSKHAGELPEDVEGNRARIDRLNTHIASYRMSKRQYEFQIDDLTREVKRLETEMMLAAAGQDFRSETAMEASERMLKALELELSILKSQYAEDNVRVQAKEAEIEAVRAQVENERKSISSERGRKSREEYTRYVIDYNRKLVASFREELVRVDEAIEKAQVEIKGTQERIITAAKLESAYLSLERDLSEAEKKYNSILLRHAEASERSNYDKYYGTVPIQIEQSAFVPAKPASPDRLMTSLVGLLLGLGIGVGVAVALHRLDRSYQRPDELRSLLPGAVLVTIPEVQSGGSRIGRALLGVLGGLILIGIFCATIAVIGVQAGWWGGPEMIQMLTNLR